MDICRSPGIRPLINLVDMLLNNQIKSAIKNHALEDVNNECCGVIIVSESGIQAIRCKNTAPIAEQAHRFIIDPTDYLMATCKGQIVAAYHSHSKIDQFSSADLTTSREIPFVMYCIESDTFYENNSSVSNEYVGKDFSLGLFDCFTLAKRYYTDKFGAKIKSYAYGEGWFDKNGSIIEDNYRQEGFSKVIDGPIKDIKLLDKDDCLLFKYSDKFAHPHHIGIYVGSGWMLHHPRNKKSRVDFLSEFYLKRIFSVVRYG